MPEKCYWDIMDNRWSQITFALIWVDTPLEVKEFWDPNQEKRKKMVEYMKEDLKDFKLWIAATSSIDITRKGIDKAYGIKKIMENLNIKKEEILFIWDCLFEWWNEKVLKIQKK